MLDLCLNLFLKLGGQESRAFCGPAIEAPSSLHNKPTATGSPLSRMRGNYQCFEAMAVALELPITGRKILDMAEAGGGLVLLVWVFGPHALRKN